MVFELFVLHLGDALLEDLLGGLDLGGPRLEQLVEPVFRSEFTATRHALALGVGEGLAHMLEPQVLGDLSQVLLQHSH